MIIGLNGQKILQKELAGPELYTLNVFKALAKIDKQNQYIVYFDSEPRKDFWNELCQQNGNFSYKVLKKFISWTQVSLALELLTNKVDVFFTAVHTIPAIHNPNTKIISVIHGLEFKINKQYYKNLFAGFIHPIVLWWVIKFSHIVITPSKATKQAIFNLKWPFINETKLKIITEGVSNIFYKRADNEIEQVRTKYNLKSSPYLLFVSTIQPRKNIPKMIEAFSLALKAQTINKDTLLVISGKNGWLFEESKNAPKKFDVEKNVLFIGRSPDEDLPLLLSGAKAFISCSLDEGFGLPLLEAMACETPAVVSDIAAFKELGHNHHIFVNPNDIDSIRKGIEDILNTDRSMQVKAAKELSKNYSWENVAIEILNVFKA